MRETFYIVNGKVTTDPQEAHAYHKTLQRQDPSARLKSGSKEELLAQGIDVTSLPVLEPLHG
jgi:hypothetical protein